MKFHACDVDYILNQIIIYVYHFGDQKPLNGYFGKQCDPDEMQHNNTAFIRVCTVCLDKSNLQRNNYNLVLEILTCDPSI